MTSIHPRTLLIACGALAEELVLIQKSAEWTETDITCLPAKLHNRPALIPDAMRKKIHENRDKYDQILAIYGDCGTSGLLDRMLEEEGVERISGAHCYEFFMGSQEFKEFAEDEPGTFYLTDYLARHFDRLIIRDLGIDRHPELLPLYFSNYKKLLYISQVKDKGLKNRAKLAAERLSLRFEYRFTGLNGLEEFLQDRVA